ncbi:MarR family transcriptional regulator [Actinoplanes sp. NPDC051411]|uniref:MarR family winged helix-turn-helix transcriptional regulator n=1 Tax=Actinoplanes sp. NPDC051411 TaxID=3155522 RepID=UPI00342003C4
MQYALFSMRLPDDLPTPATERLRLVLDVDLRLLALAERLRQHWAAHAAAVGLSTAQVKVLLILEPGQPVPMRRVAARLDSDASNLSSLVDRLERRRIVERGADARDRRIKALTLTAEGQQLRDTFWRRLTEDPGPLAALDETDLQTLATLLAPAEHDGPPSQPSD